MNTNRSEEMALRLLHLVDDASQPPAHAKPTAWTKHFPTYANRGTRLRRESGAGHPAHETPSPSGRLAPHFEDYS